MSAQEKIAIAIATIVEASDVKAAASEASKQASTNTSQRVREAAQAAHAEGISVLEGEARFASQVTFMERMHSVTIGKIFGTGFKGYMTMLKDGIDVNTMNKGEPATIQMAALHIASDAVKELTASKAEMRKIEGEVIKQAGKGKQAQADAHADFVTLVKIALANRELVLELAEEEEAAEAVAA